MSASPLRPEALATVVQEPLRGTQGFVRVMQWCWRRPSLTGLEVLWRWSFGVVALEVLWRQGTRIFAEATQGTGDVGRLGLDHLTVTEPMGATAKIAVAAGVLLPPVLRVLPWVVPALLLLWLVISTGGRALVLRRAERGLRARPATVLALQAVRAVSLLVVMAAWVGLLRWASAVAISRAIEAGAEPNLVLYFALVVVGTLVLFLVWSAGSWALSLAPLLAMAEDVGPVRALRAAVRSGPVRMKLVEINLVTGIVRVALLVLFLVFSACPLPFEAIATPDFLFWWTAGVAVLYLVASDFFHVARQVAYLELWKAYQVGTHD